MPTIPFPCCAHAVPLPCRAAKGLDCVFPIWFTKRSRVWFTHAMPRPCHTTTMPSGSDFLRPRHSAAWARHRYGMTYENYHRPSRDGMWAISPRSASSGYHAEFHGGCYQKHTNPLNCRIRNSDISGYHADFHEGHGTVGEWQGRGMECVN
jgi:hypothetical protein